MNLLLKISGIGAFSQVLGSHHRGPRFETQNVVALEKPESFQQLSLYSKTSPCMRGALTSILTTFEPAEVQGVSSPSSALQNLNCFSLDEGSLQLLAVHLANCHLASSGRGKIESVAALPQISAEMFNVYTQFTTHVENTCQFIKAELIQANQYYILDSLAASSEDVLASQRILLDTTAEIGSSIQLEIESASLAISEHNAQVEANLSAAVRSLSEMDEAQKQVSNDLNRMRDEFKDHSTVLSGFLTEITSLIQQFQSLHAATVDRLELIGAGPFASILSVFCSSKFIPAWTQVEFYGSILAGISLLTFLGLLSSRLGLIFKILTICYCELEVVVTQEQSRLPGIAETSVLRFLFVVHSGWLLLRFISESSAASRNQNQELALALQANTPVWFKKYKAELIGSQDWVPSRFPQQRYFSNYHYQPLPQPSSKFGQRSQNLSQIKTNLLHYRTPAAYSKIDAL